MTKTLLVPGLDGSPAPHWQAWWAATDPTALMVELSNPQTPVAEAWEVELGGMILRHPDCLLVAHSLGAALVTRLLARWPHLRIRGALLVAPADPLRAQTPSAHRIAAFGVLPEQALGLPLTVVGSRNDPWMCHSRAKSLANIWGADFVDLGFAGHVNVASGFGPWPGGKELRDEMIWRSNPVLNPARQLKLKENSQRRPQ